MCSFYLDLLWIIYVVLVLFCSPVLPFGCSTPRVRFGVEGFVVSHDQYGQTDYPPDVFCEYEIHAPMNYEISILFMDLDIEESNNCIFDYMTIGSNNSSNPSIFCGQSKPDYPLVIKSNVVLITFLTDSGNQGRGFKLRFEAQPRWNESGSFETCGVAPSLKSHLMTRIIGGSVANPGQWPWMVSLRYEGRFTCAGTLIHPKWIITAAHCFNSNQNLSKWTTKVGDSFLNWIDQDEQDMNIPEILMHPNYKKRHAYDFDVALLRLENPVIPSQYVRPVCLPSISVNQNYTNCYIVGWGRSESQIISEEMRHLHLSIFDQEVCNQTEAYKGMITDSMLCAGYLDGGKDACKGDSGGPLVCQTVESEVWYQIGVISFGKFCAQAGTPGIYHRISHSLDWILEKISDR